MQTGSQLASKFYSNIYNQRLGGLKTCKLLGKLQTRRCSQLLRQGYRSMPVNMANFFVLIPVLQRYTWPANFCADFGHALTILIPTAVCTLLQHLHIGHHCSIHIDVPFTPHPSPTIRICTCHDTFHSHTITCSMCQMRGHVLSNLTSSVN